MPRYAVAIALLSAAVIAYEIALMRAFSIGQWYHFAYMVISIALLGFGASGTLLSFARQRLLDAYETAFAAFATLFALAIPACFALSQKIAFDPFLLVWDRRQLLYLGEYYLALFVPFFFAASAIGLTLVRWPERTPYFYGFNLLGSGAGAVAAIGLLSLTTASRTIFWIGVIAALAAVVALSRLGRRRRFVGLAALVVVYALFVPAERLAIRISQYKGLAVSLRLPEVRIIARRSSPLGRVDVLASPVIRHAPGLSMAASTTIPPQYGLFLDAETAGAVTRFDGNLAPLEFLDWVSSALPYHLLAAQPGGRPPRVLVLGGGGGMETLQALYHRAGQVDAVELDGNVIDLTTRVFGDFSGHLYERPPVRVYRREARGFVESSRERYDLIQISLVDSFAASMAGVYALTESYLYTVEAFEAYLDHLSPSGMLAVTRWLKMPPRDNLKMFATAEEALRRRGLDPAEHIVLIRSWATATLVVKTTPFSSAEVEALKAFCAARLFDVSYYPGIRQEETNRFSILPQEHYSNAAQRILSRDRDRFFRDYAFAIRPARDDQPYFFHFFKWKALPLLLRTMGREWVPFLEWGYIVLVATLLQAAVISALLIVLPLWLAERVKPAQQVVPRADAQSPAPLGGYPRLRLFVFFLAIGLGYLFVEMALIQKLTLLLAHPLYAVAVVLAGMLMFSGVGSLVAARLDQGDWLWRSAALVALGTGLAGLFLSPLVRAGLHWNAAAKLALSLAILAPLAFFMGMPFALGLKRVGEAAEGAADGQSWVAWAWTVNGCASVLSTILATLLAMAWGFRVVLSVAAGLYLVAGWALRAVPKRSLP